VRGDRAIRLGIAIFLVGVVAVVTGWTIVRGEAQDTVAPVTPPLTVLTPDGTARAAGTEQPVGRYQFAAPDLILDTATGKLTTQSGQLLEGAIEPGGKDLGHYSVAGYMTSVTRSSGLDALNQPTIAVDLVKGYVIGDTKSGRIAKQRVYYSQPMQPGDL